MTTIRHARNVLGVLREAAALEGRFRRVVAAAAPVRRKNSRELELVEISPGVWALPRGRRAARTTLGRLHETVERIVNAFDDDDGGET